MANVYSSKSKISQMSSKNQPKLGFYRDRMSALSNLRNTFQRTSPTSSMGAGLIETESTPQGQDTTILQQVNTIESQFIEIENNLNQLSELYNNRIAALTSFENEYQIESNIEALSKKIARMLVSLKGKIMQKDTSPTTAEAQQIAANMQKGYLARMRDLSVRFREMQTSYLNKLNSVKSRADSSSISGEIDEIELENFGAFTGEQAAMVMENDLILQRRNEEIQRLLQQLDEIKSLFVDLAQLIQEQGTVLDRIDNYIEQAIDEVQKGNEELEKAEVHQKSKCFYIYLIAMLVLILILGIVILVKKSKKKKKSEGTSGGETNTTALFSILFD